MPSSGQKPQPHVSQAPTFHSNHSSMKIFQKFSSKKQRENRSSPSSRNSYVLIINNRPHRKLTSTRHGISQPFRSRNPNTTTKACWSATSLLSSIELGCSKRSDANNC